MRKLIKATLEKQNYRVLEAEDGAEAFSICRDSLAQIDLIVSDLAMPRMTGLQLKEEVVALRANMKFLLVSGYLEEAMGSPEQINSVGDFLEKPFPPDELVRKVREILSRANVAEDEPHFANTTRELRFHGADTGTNRG